MKKDQKRIILIDLDQRFKEKINDVISDSTETIYLETLQAKDSIFELYERHKKNNLLAFVSIQYTIKSGFLKTLKKNCKNLKTIVVFNNLKENSIFKLSLFDSDSHVTRTDSISEIKRTIDLVFKEGFYYKKGYIKHLKENHDYTLKSKRSIFTKRELEVLDLICKQKTTQEISEELFLSPRTVEGHRNSMMTKTDTKNVAGLIVYVFQNNILVGTQ